MNLTTALNYLENKFSLMPMHYRSSCPADSILRLNRESNAQKWENFRDRRPTAAEVRFWYKQSSLINIGAVLGRSSGGLAVMDFQGIEKFESWKVKLGDLARYLPVAKTLRGYQVFFRYEGKCQSKILARARSLAEVIKLYGHGANYLLPGSWLPTGGMYEWHYLDYVQIPKITGGQYELLVSSAKELNDATEEDVLTMAKGPLGELASFVDFRNF